MLEKGCGYSIKLHRGDLQYHWGGWSRVLWGSVLFQVFGADNAPSGQGLAVSSPEHSEVKTSLGEVREVSKV